MIGKHLKTLVYHDILSQHFLQPPRFGLFRILIVMISAVARLYVLMLKSFIRLPSSFFSRGSCFRHLVIFTIHTHLEILRGYLNSIPYSRLQPKSAVYSWILNIADMLAFVKSSGRVKTHFPKYYRKSLYLSVIITYKVFYRELGCFIFSRESR